MVSQGRFCHMMLSASAEAGQTLTHDQRDAISTIEHLVFLTSTCTSFPEASPVRRQQSRACPHEKRAHQRPPWHVRLRATLRHHERQVSSSLAPSIESASDLGVRIHGYTVADVPGLQRTPLPSTTKLLIRITSIRLWRR
jgi:hypothetical protein